MGSPPLGQQRRGAVCRAQRWHRRDGAAAAASRGGDGSVRRAARVGSRSAARSGAVWVPRGARRRGGRAGSGRAGPPQPRGSGQVRAGRAAGAVPRRSRPGAVGPSGTSWAAGWWRRARCLPRLARGPFPPRRIVGTGRGGAVPILSSPPPPPLGTGTAAPRFPSDPVPVGCREGRASGVGGAEPPGRQPLLIAPHGRVCSSPPSPWCHPGVTVGCGGGCRVSVWLHVPPPLLYPSLSVALGAAFAPSLGVSPSPPHAAPPHPGGTAGLREPPLPLVQSWRCACMHASAPAVPHTRVCKSARPRARSWQHGAAVQRCTGGGGPLLCPIVELWGGL